MRGGKGTGRRKSRRSEGAGGRAREEVEGRSAAAEVSRGCPWRRLLRVPWTARRSNQSTLKEISPGCSLEGLMLKLKLQYFGRLM